MRGNTVRLATAVGPSLAGWMLASAAFGWPPLLAAAVKIAPDLTLLARFPPCAPAGGASAARRPRARAVCGDRRRAAQSRSLLLPPHRQRPLQPLQHHPLVRPPAEDRLDDVRRQQRQPQDAADISPRATIVSYRD